MKKVISFSLYGSSDRYCLGMLINIDIINEKYNDWTIYIYYNNIPLKILNILKTRNNVKLIECKTENYKWEGMFWRFYPFDSNDIDIFLSRDADSRISDREMKLINEWISSNKCFHIIRDHLGHGVPILGGMFGVKVKNFKKICTNLKNIDFYKTQYYKVYSKNIEKQPDQIFLKKIIYPIIKNNNLTHISDESLRFSKNDILIPKSAIFCGDAIMNPTYEFND
jgi:hypothetical protein